MTPRALLAIVALSGFAATAQPVDPCKLPILKSVLPQCKGGVVFRLAPSSGVGMGSECATSNPTGTKGESLTVARTGVAECVSGDGQTITQIPANVVRQKKTSAVGSSPIGLLMEDAAANRLGAPSRNLADAAFIKTNMTCARTAPGMRGNDTNGASTCTASADNGTVLITVDHSNFAGTFGSCGSLYIKRRGGSGAVSVTYDGSIFTAITGSLGSSWMRVAKAVDINKDTAILVSSLCASAATNAVLGIKLGTSGNAVDVDFVQVETNDVIDKLGGTAGALGISLSPIELVDATPIARHADDPRLTLPTAVNNKQGCAGFTVTYGNTATLYAMPQLATDTHGGFFSYFDVFPNWWLADGFAQDNIGPLNSNITSGQPVSAECGWSGGGTTDGGAMGHFFGDISTPNPDGGANAQSGPYNGAMFDGTVMTLGTQALISGNPSELNGVMTNVVLGSGPHDCHW